MPSLKNACNMDKRISEYRLLRINQVRKQLAANVTELRKLISLEEEELDKAEVFTRNEAMNILDTNYRQFMTLCLKKGVPYDAQHKYTKKEIKQLSSAADTFDMLLALPDERLSLLERYLRNSLKKINKGK